MRRPGFAGQNIAKPQRGEINYFALSGLRRSDRIGPGAMRRAIGSRPFGAFSLRHCQTTYNHITLIAEPNVRSLAGRLSACLLRAREKAPRQSIAGTYQ
jgi:hypothetical protein